MSEQSFSLDFQGYWIEKNKVGVPSKSGVYCVYECSYNGETVQLIRLIYIGESEDVCIRLLTHEKFPQWERYLSDGHIICYSFAETDTIYRERIEAALIYEHQPPANTDNKESFNYDKTVIFTSGRNSHLKSYFTAY